MNYIAYDCSNKGPFQDRLRKWIKHYFHLNKQYYSEHLYNETPFGALEVEEVKPKITKDSPWVNGRNIINENFDALFGKNPLLVTFGEDTGKLGDVHKGLEGLQKKHGELRFTDTGIRETTIVGQGIGLALRGLRPIAEIQYLDYLIFALQTLSDDVATTHWRTRAGQIVPLIVRTRGHRLEGIWHSGSPLGMIINSLRGVFVCVPRNMTQAAGLYNTLLEGQDPALVIEPLNGYGIKEQKPENLGEYRIPLGVPEILEEGNDITLVSYGSCLRIAQEAVKHLKDFNISVELIDIQTLIPFDRKQVILNSIKKTHKVVFLDEDVPGGTTAYMMQQVLEKQKGYYYLDAEPRTVSGQDHRPAYTADGDYFSKSNPDDVFDVIYELMNEYQPAKYPEIS